MNSKIFGKTFIFLLVCLFVLDLLIGKVLKFSYFNQKNGKLYNLTIGLEHQQNDVLIFGSSRAMHHYDPEIISDSLMMTCYNMGYDGKGILYHNAVLDVILERYTPKIIVLDILSEELFEKPQSYDHLSILNPYAHNHPVLWNTLSLVSPFEKLKHISFIYPYNSTLLRVIAGNIKRGGKDISDNGFTPQDGLIKLPVKQVPINMDVRIDSNKLDAFDKFLLKCAENNVELYIVFSPTFSTPQASSSMECIADRCDDIGIPFINFSNNRNYTNYELFLDVDHLNSHGAVVFSKDIASKILKERK